MLLKTKSRAVGKSRNWDTEPRGWRPDADSLSLFDSQLSTSSRELEGRASPGWLREVLILSGRFCNRILFALLLVSFSGGLLLLGQEEQNTIVTPHGDVLAPSKDGGLKVVRAKESFSTLTLEGSDLRPEPPLSGGHVSNADFARELVRLQWRPGDPIDTYVIRPAKVKKPPVVLYLYGYPTELDRFRNKDYANRVVSSGAAAVGFLSARTGYRAEHHPMREWFVPVLPESLTTTVHDVQLILNYLATRDDLDTSRVGIYGQGSGGAIAVLAAATDPRIKAIDLVNPWGDWPDWLAKAYNLSPSERERCLKPEFLKSVESLDPVAYLPKLVSLPMRMQFVDVDMARVKVAMAKLEKAAPASAKVLHYPDGVSMYRETSDGRLFEWIAAALKSPTETKQAATTTTH